MESSKLIGLLKTFDKAEIKKLSDFVDSPYFNKNKEVVKLYAYIKLYAPHFPPKRIQRQVVFKTVFKNKPYDDKKMRRLMSALLKLAEQFVGLQKYQSSPGISNYYEMSSFIDRELDKHHEYNYKKAQQTLEASSLRNADYYYQKYLLADTMSQQFFNKKIRRYDQSLQDTSDFFDVYFLSKKLIYSCEMINRNKIISKAYKPKFLKEIQLFLNRYPLHSVPFIHIYYNIFMMLTSKEGTTYFQTLKKLLNDYEDHFLVKETREMFSHALNYSIRRLNQGNQPYLEESFNLCRYGIEKGLMTDNNYLSPWAYKNVIKMGLMLSKYDWVKEFIETQTNDLAPNFRQNALHFNLADLYYSTKDFDQAQYHLNQFEYSDIYIAIDSKILLMKIYYESNEHDTLFSALAAFKQFIIRNKILSAIAIKKYKNFLFALNLLVKLEQKAVTECKQFLNSDEPIAERNWLKEMANQ